MIPVRLNKPEVLIDWSFITYNGIIYNNFAKKKVTLASIHGQSFMLNEKEKVEEVTLLKNAGDSILVAYQGKSKWICLPNK